MEAGKEYIFFCNYEDSDDNGNIKMYDRKMNLLSDNYFASQAFMKEMEKIHKNQMIVYFTSPEIALEIQIREEDGLFDDEI